MPHKLAKPTPTVESPVTPADASHPRHDPGPRAYTLGFFMSLALTFEAYTLVSSHSFSRISLMVIVLLLAIVQLVVQLIFFLHLDRATKAPWNIIILLFTGMVVSVVVFGSLWIMHNLDYHMLPGGPAQAETYMREHEGL